MKRWTALFIINLSIYIIFSLYCHQFYPKREQAIHFTPPPPAWALKIMDMGQHEAMAELLFTKLMFYNEEKKEYEGKNAEPDLILKVIDTATKLDPYNMDCYYFAQALLSDNAAYIKPLNKILLRGMKYRKHDFYLPWFIGVNYYFTLTDPAKAAPFFAETARRKPNSRLFSTLASRVFYEGGMTEQAIVFLKSILSEIHYPALRNKIKIRLQALETVLFLQNAVKIYKKKMHQQPRNLSDLVKAGILKSIPPDPYGGTFYLTQSGHIYTTSKFTYRKKEDEHSQN